MEGGNAFDPYKTLGLQPGVGTEEVRRQYRRLALQHHPDKVPPEAREEASRRFQEIARAYEVLSDPARRMAWDQHGSTDGMPFEDPMDLFRSVWEALEESGFLHSVHVPSVPADLFANPEAKIAMRILHVIPAPAVDLPPMEEALPAWVAKNVPLAAQGPAGDWMQRQGRTLGQWADAFLQRRKEVRVPPTAPVRQILVRAPLAEVWAGARKRIRYERPRASGGIEKATCVIPLRLPGLTLEGAAGGGADLHVFVEPTLPADDTWFRADTYDLRCIVRHPDVVGLWMLGGVVALSMPDGTKVRVRIAPGVPTQSWRLRGRGFPHGIEDEAERGDLYLFLVPGKGAEAHDEQQEEDVVDVQPVLPEGLENLMWTASTPSPSPPAPSL